MVEQENESFKRTFAREKEHRAKLEKLGLTEAEALEYVLMLSREEALGRGVVDANQAISEEGVFDIDESLRSAGHAYEGAASTSSLRRSPSLSSVSTVSDQTWSSYSESPASYSRYAAANPQGVETSLPLSISSSVPSMMSGTTTTSTLGGDEFPPIAVSPTSSIASGSRSPSSKSPGKSWSSVAGTSPPGQPTRSASGPRRFRPVGAGAVKYTSDSEMDEDLRYALEVSLAEAQSRGQT